MSDSLYDKMMGSADPASPYARTVGGGYGPPRSVRQVAQVTKVCPECGVAFSMYVPAAEAYQWRVYELECGECARVKPEEEVGDDLL